VIGQPFRIETRRKRGPRVWEKGWAKDCNERERLQKSAKDTGETGKSTLLGKMQKVKVQPSQVEKSGGTSDRIPVLGSHMRASPCKEKLKCKCLPLWEEGTSLRGVTLKSIKKNQRGGGLRGWGVERPTLGIPPAGNSADPNVEKENK